ncbi:MAG: hypothetical protein V7K47_14840 [Nostoc sp.]
MVRAEKAIAYTYKGGSIVLPKLGDMQEQVQSEIQARAEQESDVIDDLQKYVSVGFNNCIRLRWVERSEAHRFNN